MELPLEIYAAIALQSVRTWRDMLVVCEFGRWTLTEQGKRGKQELCYVVYKDNYVMMCLGNVPSSTDDHPTYFGVHDDKTYAMWIKDGLLHRVGGPAYVVGQVKFWMQNGYPHRVDGPAHEDGNDWTWYFMGAIHREDGPARSRGGVETRYLYGEYGHEFVREDGTPGIVYGSYKPPLPVSGLDGTYSIKKLLAKKDDQTRTDLWKAIYNTLQASEVVGGVLFKHLTFVHTKDGLLHNSNGPAAYGSYGKNGTRPEIWAIAGRLHRVGGPAFSNGKFLYWFVDGLEHRTDGPTKKTKRMEIWRIRGEVSRKNGPAHTIYYSDGTVKSEHYFSMGTRRNMSNVIPDWSEIVTKCAAVSTSYLTAEERARVWKRIMKERL